MATGLIYRPLNVEQREIRVLVARRRTVDDRLDCTLKHVSLLSRAHHAFDAISYTWSDAKQRRDVIIDGQVIDIPASSEIALRNLRGCPPFSGIGKRPYDNDRLRTARALRSMMYHSHWFWIDAICIDQTNIAERNQQVTMMGDVHRQAAVVRIWLGEDTDGTVKAAMGSLEMIYQQASDETDGLRDIVPKVQGLRRGFKEAAPLPSGVDWTALTSLYSAAWFQRTWTIQRVHLARQAVCVRGRYQCPVDRVVNSAMWLNYRWAVAEIESTAAQRGIMAWAVASRIGRRASLGTVLQSVFQFHATDPRDKIFAFHGLMNAVPEYLMPDYHVQVRELFVRATKFAITEEVGGFPLLALSQLPISSDKDSSEIEFPSWIVKG